MNDHQIKVAVRALLMDLPDSLHGYFLDHDQLHKIMTRGGFPGLPWDKVCSAALGWRNVLIPAADRLSNKQYYRLGMVRSRRQSSLATRIKEIAI
jgi:hypothetical protein